MNGWPRRRRLGRNRIDPKGLALFYAAETGYTFARLTDGARDPNVRWLVAHEAFLHGPWDYCKLLTDQAIQCCGIRVLVPPVWPRGQIRWSRNGKCLLQRVSRRSGFVSGVARSCNIPNLCSGSGKRSIVGFSQLHPPNSIQHQPQYGCCERT